MILSASLFFHGSKMSKLMMPYLCSRQEEKGEKRIVPNTFFSLTRKVKLSPKASALDKSLPQLRHIPLSARMSGKVDSGWSWLIYTIKIHSMGWGHSSTPIKIKVLINQKEKYTLLTHVCPQFIFPVIFAIRSHREGAVEKYFRAQFFQLYSHCDPKHSRNQEPHLVSGGMFSCCSSCLQGHFLLQCTPTWRPAGLPHSPGSLWAQFQNLLMAAEWTAEAFCPWQPHKTFWADNRRENGVLVIGNYFSQQMLFVFKMKSKANL